MNFKEGDIVQYVQGTRHWIENKYRFKVLHVDDYQLVLITLQDIYKYDNPNRIHWKKDSCLTLEKHKFAKVNSRNRLPEWL